MQQSNFEFPDSPSSRNVGPRDRAARLVVAAALFGGCLLLRATGRGLEGWCAVLVVLGLFLALTGLVRWCPVLAFLGRTTLPPRHLR